MNSLINVLGDQFKETFDFIGELNQEQLNILNEHMVYEELEAGTTIVKEGGICQGLALVLSGELRISIISEDGREVTLYRIGKSEICSLSAACILGSFSGNRFTVTTEVDTRIVWIKKEFFALPLAACEPFYRFLLGDISDRLFRAMELVESVAFISLKKRLAHLLLVESNNGKHPVYKTHEALSRELGTARAVISRELKSLEVSGMLSLSRGRLTINSVSELAAIAKG